VTPQVLLDRIAALIALASSPQLEEARTAAHKACSMLREHGALIGFEDDGVLATKAVGVAKPVEKAAPRRTSDRRTVMVFRCARCGQRVAKQGSRCAACIEQSVPMGIWTVDCQGCGRSTPPGRSEMEVNDIALRLGFTITDDGVTLCPVCTKARKTA